jgi:hypothetical protein
MIGHVCVNITWTLSVYLNVLIFDVLTLCQNSHGVNINTEFAHTIWRLGKAPFCRISLLDRLLKLLHVTKQLLLGDRWVAELSYQVVVLKLVIFSKPRCNSDDFALVIQKRDNCLAQFDGAIEVL